MTRLSKTILAGLATAALLAGAPETTLAQSYPTKPIRLVVPAAPGGISDLTARILADWLDKATGQRVLLEHKPGAGGNVGADIIAKAAPDGYTLCLISTGNVAINPFVYKAMPFDALTDLVPVAPIVSSDQVVIVNSNLPVRNLQELIDLAKREPGKLNFSSAGVATTVHLAGELFAHMAGVKLVHVPYRGAGPAVADLATGQVQASFIGLGAIRGQLQAGTIRALAVAGPKRLSALPDVPTATEAGLPGYEFQSWFGVVTTKGTPPEVVAILNRHINAMLDDPDIQKRMQELGMEPLKETPEQYAARIKRDFQVYGDIVRRANVTLD